MCYVILLTSSCLEYPIVFRNDFASASWSFLSLSDQFNSFCIISAILGILSQAALTFKNANRVLLARTSYNKMD